MAEQAQEWWREAIPKFGMRSLFHALCDLGRDDPPEPVLDYASGQPCLADLAERFSQLSVLDRTHPYQPGDEQLRASLALLYAASRVRDVLLMIGELVFARAGVRVRAGAAHARPGVADRSTMYWEYWRRHRPTIDDSFGWGTNSQWQTAFRRDYRITRGSVFNLDARSAQALDPPELTGAEAAEFVKNRCALRAEPDDQFTPPDQMIDERSSS